MTDHLLPVCVCGSSFGERSTNLGIPLIKCACGIVRQIVTMTSERLDDWYRENYFAGVYSHTYQHDRTVASKRLAAYRLPAGAKLLDVGCGNGAFVHEARECGIDAWGQDVSAVADGPYVYGGELLRDVAFPTDEFDVVTIHDVLEHLVDPHAALLEVRRILKPGGKLIVDFPRFWHESGQHHWKPIEHLWMFTDEQLVHLLATSGFAPGTPDHPLDSKTILYGERTLEYRPRIVVPAGIGDAYWVMVKLPGFLKAHGLGAPDVFVQDSGPRRTEVYLRTLPLVRAAGYYEIDRRYKAVWHEAYMKDGRTIYKAPFPKVDWFIAYNGVLRYGRRLQGVDPELGCDWRPRMHMSKEARAVMARERAAGPYAVVYLADGGMYRNWWSEFGPQRVYDALRQVGRENDLRIVFVGAYWDKATLGWSIAEREPSASWVNLIGQTSYDALYGITRGASLVCGWPSGATLLAPSWDVPTYLVWSKYFREEFWTSCVDPTGPYRAVDCAGLTVDKFAADVKALLTSR